MSLVIAATPGDGLFLLFSPTYMIWRFRKKEKKMNKNKMKKGEGENKESRFINVCLLIG